MDENAEVQGGLSAVAPAAVNPTDAPEAPKQSGFDTQKYLDDLDKSRQALDARRVQLLKTIENRRTPMFDPRMLAVASGMLRPTKSGSFGESLGYATEGLAGAQEKQQQQEQEYAKMQYEMELATLADRQKDFARRHLMSLSSGPSGAPAAANLPSPASQTSALSPSAEVKQPESNIRRITQKDLAAAFASGDKDYYGQIEQMYKNQIEEDKLKYQGREVETREASVKRYLPGVGSIEMPMAFWNKLESAKSFPEVQEVYKKYNLPLNITETTEGGQRFKTAEEIAAGGKGSETTQTERAKGSEASRTQMMAQAKMATEMINNGTTLFKLASDPKTSGAFGILDKPGILPAIGKLVSEGISVGGYSIGIPAIEDALRTAGATPAEIEASKIAAQKYAMAQLAVAKADLKGEGAVSDAERRTVASVTGSLRDSPKVAMFNAEILQAHGRFNKETQKIYYAWEDKHPNMPFERFLASPEYERHLDNYNNYLGKLEDKYLPSSKKSESKPASRKQSFTSSDLLNQIRGQ